MSLFLKHNQYAGAVLLCEVSSIWLLMFLLRLPSLHVQALARLWRVAHFVLSDFLNLSLQQSDETASPLLGLYMAPAEPTMAGHPTCPVPKPSNRPAHKRGSLKKPDTASAVTSGKNIQFSSDAVADTSSNAAQKRQAGAASAPGQASSDAIMISPFSNYTGHAEEKQVEQARMKALSRSFEKRQQSRKSHLEVVEEADKEGDSGEEGQCSFSGNAETVSASKCQIA